MKKPNHFNSRSAFRIPIHRMGMASSVVLLASVFIFCGCLTRQPLNEQTFAFCAPEWPATNGTAGDGLLDIKSLQIAAPFDGRAFTYRTGEFSFVHDPYAGFLSFPAGELVATISEMLQEDGGFRIVPTGSGLRPDTLLEISVRELYGDIRRPGSPEAVLGLQMVFIQATNGLPGRVILQRNYARRIPVKSSRASALMAGWNRALAEIIAEAASDFRRQEKWQMTRL